MVGRGLFVTMTVILVVELLPQQSVACQVTMVVPRPKVPPTVVDPVEPPYPRAKIVGALVQQAEVALALKETSALLLHVLTTMLVAVGVMTGGFVLITVTVWLQKLV